MFYPQAMTEIELIVPAKDLIAVTKVLSGRSIFHQTDSSFMGTDAKSGSANIWQEKAVAYSGLERRILNIMQSTEMAEGMPPAKEIEGMSDLDVVRPVVDKIEQEVKRINEVISNENKRIEQLENIHKQLEPIADIDLDISQLRSSHFLYAVLGMMPVSNVERLQTSLSRIPFIFLPLRQEEQNAVVWLAGAASHTDILERAARSAYLNPFSLPETFKGTPAEIIKSTHAQIEEARKNIQAQKAELSRLREVHQKELQPILWDVRASRMMTDAIVRYGRLKYTYLIVGWVIAEELAGLTERIHAVSKETLIETYPIVRDGNTQNVPVSLKNPKATSAFQGLVTTFGRPRYSEIDPTIIMTIMFPFLFGAMFGDVGQGLVLAGFGWLLSSKKVKSMRGLAGLGGVITGCGLSATVFGFLYGSVFGFEEVIPALWFHPVKHMLDILMIAVLAGLVLLSIAFILGLINAYKAKDWPRFWIDHFGVAGLVLYWSLIGVVGSTALPNFPIPQVVFTVLALVSGVVVMFAEVFKHLMIGHRPLIEGSLGIYFIQAFFEIFETVISYLSNSLSFVRVGAFAVAHGGLSTAIFILAELASPTKGFGYWLTILLGNLFIVGFEGLIVGIQTMRLSYYEFFGKFFTGGGLRYEPLNVRPTAHES